MNRGFFYKGKKSLKRGLNKIGPINDLCGNPGKILLQALVTLFISTPCYQFARYE